MEALFVEVLKLCREAGLIKLGVVALDGTKIKAIIVDPSAASFIAELRKRGYKVLKANNDVLDGIRLVGMLLNLEKIVFASSCKETIKEFASYIWDEKALERGVRVTGATVHFVDTGTDTGPIILQKAVKIKSDDTPEVLQRRVMEKAEWKILPKAINLIANDKVKVVDGRVETEEFDTEE